MRGAPRGRLPIVSANPETQKTLVRAGADSARIERVVVVKTAQEREIEKLLANGSLISANEARRLAIQSTTVVSEEKDLQDLFRAEETSNIEPAKSKDNSVRGQTKHVTMFDDTQVKNDILQDEELISILHAAEQQKSETSVTEKKARGAPTKKKSE